jgi:hypothetical protein
MSRYLIICRWCGDIFRAERRKGETCGDACRKNRSRYKTIDDDWRARYFGRKSPFLFAEHYDLARWLGLRLPSDEPTFWQRWSQTRFKEQQHRIKKGDKRYRLNRASWLKFNQAPCSRNARFDGLSETRGLLYFTKKSEHP